MTVIDIDETTDVGRDILRRVSSNPVAGTVRDFEILVDDDDDDGDQDDFGGFSHFTKEELDSMRAEIMAENLEEEEIPCDENGNPIGYTLDEVFAGVDKMLSETYGIDFAKVSRMIASGELKEAEITDELLRRQEFEYKPYPGFKPQRVTDNFKPEPWLLDVL